MWTTARPTLARRPSWPLTRSAPSPGSPRRGLRQRASGSISAPASPWRSWFSPAAAPDGLARP
eukprot:8387081-Lingulodinium_polyedra.AAC.1